MLSKLYKWFSDKWIEWISRQRPFEGNRLCDFGRICFELRPCDVILVEGRSHVADIIQAITQSTWSHSALYIGRLHDIEDPEMRKMVMEHYKGPFDSQLVIEGMMGEGTIINNITKYEDYNLRICRPRGLSHHDAKYVINYAIKKLGTDYDVRLLIDLARFLLPWSFFPRRFRSKLFEHHAGESTRTVCSTMIAEAFGSVEFPVLPLVKEHDTKGIELIKRNPRLYSPSDFDHSPYFDIIKIPFIECTDYPLYRRLPWNRDGLISDDREGIRKVHQPQNSQGSENLVEKYLAETLENESLNKTAEKKDAEKKEKEKVPPDPLEKRGG